MTPPKGYVVVQAGDTTYLLPDIPRLYTCKPCGADAWITTDDYRTFSCDCGCSCENHWSELETDGPHVSPTK